jgi:hypothetical protein
MSRALTHAVILSFAALAPATGQGIVLELKPRAGDTLRMRLDQQTDITGARAGGRPMSVTTSVIMHSRAIVLGTEGQSALILAITDSVAVESNDQHALALAEQARRGMEGRQVKLRLSPDGTMGLADGDRQVRRDVKEMVSIMPGSFPREPLAVGDTWVREMPIPGSAQMNLPAGGRVRARFRLDSLSRGGELAWVSMRGTFEPASDDQKADAAAGSVHGTLVVNRRRGWLSESRFVIEMRSTVPMPASDGRAPLRFRTRITQLMKVLGDRRP